MDEKAKRKNSYELNNPADFFLAWVLSGSLFLFPIVFLTITGRPSWLMLIATLALILICHLWQNALLKRHLTLNPKKWSIQFISSILFWAVAIVVIGAVFMPNILTIIISNYSPLPSVPEGNSLESPRFILQEGMCFFSNQGQLAEGFPTKAYYGYEDISISEYVEKLQGFIGITLMITLLFQLFIHSIQSEALQAELEHLSLWILLPTIAALPLALSLIALGTANLPDISQCKPILGMFVQAIRILGNPVMLLLTFLLIPISEALVLIHLAKYHRRETLS